MKSLDGVVKVAKELPNEISIRDLAAVKVPNRVTEDHIVENVEPIFKSKGNIRLATYFPTVNMRKTAQKSSVDSVACLGMFGTLELQPQVNEVVDLMIERLKTLSRKSDGQFIAVDLRVEILENKNCHGSGSTGAKSCYNAQEIALFLRKVGFDTDTTIYLTQSRWDSSLSVLKDIFPKTYTKVRYCPCLIKVLLIIFSMCLLNYYMQCLTLIINWLGVILVLKSNIELGTCLIKICMS